MFVVRCLLASGCGLDLDAVGTADRDRTLTAESSGYVGPARVRAPSNCPKVGVVIVNWRSVADTLRCLSSVFASTPQPLRTVVVDNSGTREASLVLAQRYPSLPVVLSDQNLGYTGGNNIGIRSVLASGVDYVLLLNDDAVLDAEALSYLVDAAKLNPDAGFLGPKVHMLEDPHRILSVGMNMTRSFGFAHRGIGELDRGQYEELSEVDALSGCALFAGRNAIETVGLLDERFFAYFEDADWCYRARAAGLRVLCVPEARVWHPDTRSRDVDSALVTYYGCRNRLLFIAKHRLGPAVLFRALAEDLRTIASWSLRPAWRHKACQRDALVRAIGDFARNRYGKANGIA